MKTTYTFEGKNPDDQLIKLQVELFPATILEGIEKDGLLGEGLAADLLEQQEAAKSGHKVSRGRSTAHIVLYPPAMAAAQVITYQVDGVDQPLDFEAFIRLPETAVLEWLNKVYEVNPHWGNRPQTDEVKKKPGRKRHRI